MKYNKRAMDKKWVYIWVFFLLPTIAGAQKIDTLASLKQFVQVCNNYKKVPLHISLNIYKTADVPASAEDTAFSKAEFFITGKESYVRLNNLEQMVNDSLMLLVNNDARQMILYANNTPVNMRLSAYLGLQMQDSSLQKMAQNYTAVQIAAEKEGDTAVIELKSRAVIGATALPKETVQVTYSKSSYVPFRVVVEDRKLIPLDSVGYNTLLVTPKYAGKLINPGKDNFFLVNTHTTTFIYNVMSYSNDVLYPAEINDRVVKDGEKHYVPAKGYETFRVIDNL